jgi:hypothetical protein
LWRDNTPIEKTDSLRAIGTIVMGVWNLFVFAVIVGPIVAFDAWILGKLPFATEPLGSLVGGTFLLYISLRVMVIMLESIGDTRESIPSHTMARPRALTSATSHAVSDEVQRLVNNERAWRRWRWRAGVGTNP